VAVARSDSSPTVRSQLACSAKRLPGQDCLPIVRQLLQRREDVDDPHIPLLLWWAIEDKAISDRPQVLALFAAAEAWRQPLIRGVLPRLVRRYAAEGTGDGYASCQKLWDAAPETHRESMLAALFQGLTERSRGLSAVSAAGLFDAVAAADEQPEVAERTRLEPLTAELSMTVISAWRSKPDDALRIRLALEAGVDEPYRHVIAGLKSSKDAARLKERLAIMAEYGREDCVPAVLALAGEGQTDEIRALALGVLRRFSSDKIAAAVVAAYPRMSESLQSRARDLLFSRPASALAFLQLLEEKRLDPASVPVDQLRRLALFHDNDIDARVRKHWGNIQPGTPEEKLADMRRFSNDLRAGSGDPARGAALFKKHCATCHKLKDEGNSIGPDLTNTVKGDPVSLLASIVDPSAVVRREFSSYVVLTTAGTVQTGLIADQDAASVTLLDAKNERTRINRDQIEEISESPTSLMPEKLLEQLSPQELRDLFAYLRS